MEDRLYIIGYDNTVGDFCPVSTSRFYNTTMTNYKKLLQTHFNASKLKIKEVNISDLRDCVPCNEALKNLFKTKKALEDAIRHNSFDMRVSVEYVNQKATERANIFLSYKKFTEKTNTYSYVINAHRIYAMSSRIPIAGYDVFMAETKKQLNLYITYILKPKIQKALKELDSDARVEFLCEGKKLYKGFITKDN